MSKIIKAFICLFLAGLVVVFLCSHSEVWEKVASILIAVTGVLVTLFYPTITNNYFISVIQSKDVEGKAPADTERTSITLQNRNLNSDSQKESWYPTVVANEGDIIRFKVTYTNKSGANQNDVLVFVKWSEALEYIPGSTILYNSNHKKGLKLTSDGLADDTGINIGNYKAGASGVVTYEAKVKDGLVKGMNYLRNWTQIYVNDLTPELEKDFVQDYADVMVEIR